jgi:hypothetical protein
MAVVEAVVTGVTAAFLFWTHDYVLALVCLASVALFLRRSVGVLRPRAPSVPHVGAPRFVQKKHAFNEVDMRDQGVKARNLREQKIKAVFGAALVCLALVRCALVLQAYAIAHGHRAAQSVGASASHLHRTAAGERCWPAPSLQRECQALRARSCCCAPTAASRAVVGGAGQLPKLL